MVNTALGTHVGDPEQQLLTNVAVCTYKPAPGTIGTVIIRMETDTTRTAFDQARHASDANGIPTADLSGFEDAAYTSTISALSVTTNTVVALKGTTEVLVSSGASFDAEKALEQQIFAALHA
jgi:hypothetical protein